ncbi:MAG TPA: tyrosine-type recombinase/integrase, partial [Anaerolineae bacterium]
MNAITAVSTRALTDQPAVPWSVALDPFLNTLNSPQTRRAYRAAIAEAMAALAVESIDEITPPPLTEYRAGLVARLDARGARRLSPSSVALKLAALRAFLKFCRLTGLTRLTAEVIAYTLESPSAKVVKPYDVLTLAEQARVLAVLKDRPRDRALVALALGAGLRAAELTAAKVGDILSDDDGADWIRVVQGKGRKDRLVPLSPEVAAVVRQHATGCKSSDYLFPSRQGESGQMTTARVWQIITDAVRAAGIAKRLSPHSMRHTYALGRLRAGASPVAVQKLLGHASLSTTQKYVDHLELADLR